MQTMTGEFILDRMVRAVNSVRDRLLRAATALDTEDIPYAVVGSNAVSYWISQIDESAVRNTQHVNILLRRSDLPGARIALEAGGFVYRIADGVVRFLDAPGLKPRDSVRIHFADETPHTALASLPSVEARERGEQYWVIRLEHLVFSLLSRFKLDDRVDIRDLIDVDLIDESWLPRLPAELAERLKSILDTPEG